MAKKPHAEQRAAQSTLIAFFPRAASCARFYAQHDFNATRAWFRRIFAWRRNTSRQPKDPQLIRLDGTTRRLCCDHGRSLTPRRMPHATAPRLRSRHGDTMNAPVLGPIDQIGYVVADLERSIARWRARHDAGPWTVFRHVRLDGRYRGEPVTVTMDVALAYRGELQIELIHVTNDAPSPYRDAQGHALAGLHHVAWVVDDLDAAVARLTARGMQVVFDAHNPATRVAYLDDADDPGVLVEVIEGAGMRAMIAHGIAEARTWNGTDPVRIIDASAAA
jgi:catechol 2,3-dioxygenase-like lactoylglutathione lyase family enzyme